MSDHIRRSAVPSVPPPIALRPDLVLVALPPRTRRTGAAGLIVLPDEWLVADRAGLVLQVGDRVEDVAPRDRVLFDTTVGEEITVNDWPCVLLRACDIDAVLES